MLMFPSKSIRIFILLSFAILLQPPNVTADEKVLLQVCTPNINYTSGSQFGTNLNLLLNSLVSGGSRGDGFFNTSVGENPDIVYGLAQCRPDLSIEDCNNCLISAAGNVTEPCHNSKAATIRYEGCTLRYSNSNFFSKNYTVVSTANQGKDIPDADVVPFSQHLEVLMKNLSKTASQRPTRFSSGDTQYAPFKTIYGMVECTRDLSPSGCEYCLHKMISIIPDYNNGTTAATFCTETCYIRYDVDVLDVASPGPPQSKQRSGTNGGKSLNILFTILAIIASIMFPCFAKD